MKRSFPFLLLLIVASAVSGQSNQTPPKPDLSKFSSNQLRACYENKRICGVKDELDISVELAGRLPSFSTKQLLSCFANWKICGVSEDGSSGWPISDELARRGTPHNLLLHYWSEPNGLIRVGIVHVAYHFKSPETTAFMQRVLSERKGEDEEMYWPANYLAKQCDPNGLKWLIARPQRSQGCLQFATTVPLFGKCLYRPAIPYLINYSLHDACLNIVDAAEIDLRRMYPHSPKEFESIEEMQRYFCSRARREGFRMHCVSK